MRTVAALGKVLDINTWSNIPYFFHQAGFRRGFIQGGWCPDMDGISWRRLRWNAIQWLVHGTTGGYQYSHGFLDRVERSVPAKFKGSEIITFSQHFPRADTVKQFGGTLHYYIDTTFYDLVHAPEYRLRLPARVIDEVLDAEKYNYQEASVVVAMGGWVMDSLKKVYGLPEQKIYTVLPGANMILPGDFRFFDDERRPGRERDFVMGFVGKDWERKGLGLTNEVRRILTGRGWKVELRIIGSAPREIAVEDGVRYFGFVDKQSHNDEFVRIIAPCDLGCLFSKHEALGISTLEFLRVGVPVAGYYHQGLRDTLLEGASLRVPPDENAAQIADRMEEMLKNPAILIDMRRKACSYSEYVTWERCIDEWKELMSRIDGAR